MDPLKAQLEALRARLQKIDERYQAEPLPQTRALPDGQEVRTEDGTHWEIDRHWPAHHRHGTADVGALSELPQDLLAALVNEEGVTVPPERWAFLDTETSGLSGGSGAFAFLVGVGGITANGFVLKQFFMRDHGEEPSMLKALSAYLDQFDLLVTYNGRSFDQPLLETRYRLLRIREPFPRLKHVDLLYSARRLWRLALESCRLQELEQRILGVERHGDVDGQFIPNLYFEYLRTGNFAPLRPVISHNAVDILSLACLTAIVPVAFREPQRLTSGAEMVALARWFRNEGRAEDALMLMRQALKRSLDEALLYETLWHVADMERKLERHDAAVEVWTELSTIRNPWQAKALERLAIHYERREKNLAMAFEMTLAAQIIEDSEALQKRAARLSKKASGPKSGRLL
ncbi:MAG: ribonuclease H-like domain-containing protein [Paludibaculum sp.]